MPATPRSRILITLTLALAADTTVYGLVVPFMPGHAEQLGLDAAGIGLLFGVYALSLLGASWFLMRTLHRWSPRALIVGGLLGLGFTSVAFAAAESSITGLFIARSLQGASAAAPWIAGPSIIATLYPAASRGTAMGILLSGSSIGMIAGPPLGGLLYEWGGFSLPFLGVGMPLLLVAVLAGWSLRGLERSEGPGLSLRTLLGQNVIFKISGIGLFAASLLALLEPVLPLHFEQRFQTDALDNGLLFGAAVLANAIAAPLAGQLSDRIGRMHTIRWGLLGVTVSFPLVALAPTLLWTALAMALVGAAVSLALTPTMPALADAIDALQSQAASQADYAAAFFLFNIMYGAGMFIGPAFGGFLTQTTNLLTTLILAAGSSLVLAIWLHPAPRNLPGASSKGE